MNYFELYNFSETLRPDPVQLRKAWGERSRIHHPDRFVNATQTERLEALQKTSINNEAYRTLKDQDATLAYILGLHGVLAKDEKYTLPPDFLMEMMDMNEAADAGQLSASSYQSAADELDNLMAPLAIGFEQGARDTALLLAMKDVYFRKKYLHRLKERLA